MRRNFHDVREPRVMIIPMIDIMLFLLVFFMLSTMYMVNASTVQVNLPQAATAQQDTRPHIVSITVTEDGKVMFDRDEEPTRELTTRVKTQLEDDPDTVFVVRGDRKADYQYVVAVFDALKDAPRIHRDGDGRGLSAVSDTLAARLCPRVLLSHHCVALFDGTHPSCIQGTRNTSAGGADGVGRAHR